MLLSVVVPCYNEDKVIEKLYRVVKQHIELNKLISDYEFIFVDDGSTDKTLEKVKGLRNLDHRVRFISFSRNFGKEAGIYAGLKASKGDLTVLMDADLQHPPELLKRMSELILLEGYDSVGTIRKNRRGEGKIKSFFSSLFYKFINSISDTYIEQNSTDYRMMNRKFLNSVLSLSEYNRFTKGIFSWVGHKNAMLEFKNIEREAGKSKWGIMNLFKYSLEGIISFSTVPLVVSSIMGIISFAVAIVIVIVFLFKFITVGEVVKGFPTTICAIFLLGGVQLLSIGILGQYFSKAYLEIKNRPVYIAEETSEDEKIQ